MVRDFLQSLLEQVVDDAGMLSRVISIAIIIAFSFLGYLIANFLIKHYVKKLIAGKAPEWDRVLTNRKVYRLSAYFVPFVIAAALAPVLLSSSDGMRTLFAVLTWIMTIVLITWIINNLLNALLDMYSTYDLSKTMPLTGLAQATKVILYLMAGFLIISILLDLPLVYFLAGFIALVTAASFVLKDPILGFMAGIQLAANKMVAIGDRVQIPHYNIDGFLEEITLITVKIRNIDSSISTVPTYGMISGSFRNWKEIIETDGRRIKDPLYVDIRSLKIVDPDFMARLRSSDDLRLTLEKVNSGVEGIGLRLPASATYPETDGNLTNLGLFRTYAIDYLHRHPGINDSRPISVHILEGTDQGIPVEVWAFAKETIVPGFHRIRSEIFEHFFSMLPIFELTPFQSPTGDDLLAAITAESSEQTLNDSGNATSSIL